MIHFDLPKQKSSIIKVVGVGGGGSNAVNFMFDDSIEGVDFIICNTDGKALEQSPVPNKIQLGPHLTQGLGAGANPEVGKMATEESMEEIRRMLEVNTKMVFITAGMGGGTGTGAAPIIASLAAELGALTVAVVTKPFPFEGRRRLQQADLGLQELRSVVDTLITIPNERLKQTVDRNMTLADSFRMADDVLRQAVQGISDLITVPGFINVDFADVKSIMKGMGIALMGTGHALGDNRAQEATQRAISSPLLEEATIEGAKGVLVNITGGADLTLFEVDEAMHIIHDAADPDANIIFGTVTDEKLQNEMKITVIATGFEKAKAAENLHNFPVRQNTVAPNAPRIIGNTNSIQPARQEDYETPAYIRKKAD